MLTELLLSGAVRAAIVLAAGLGAAALLGRAAATTRRLVLLVALGAAAAVPVAATLGPRWSVETPAALSVFAHESATEGAPTRPLAAPASAPTAPTAPVTAPTGGSALRVSWLACAWLVVAVGLLARAGSSHLRVRALVRRASVVEAAAWRAGVRVRASTAIASPIVAGLVRPTLVIPHAALTWPAERCRLVLAHELAHVRRRDVLAQAIAEVACALQWFNPLVWLCARRLRAECERAADDAVLAAGVRPSRYAEELVAVAAWAAGPRAALAMAERSTLEARVAAILAARCPRTPLATWATTAVASAGVLLAAAVACAAPHGRAPTAALQPGTATDPAIQRVAEDELAALTHEWAPDLATIVVLDPATGEILANAGSRDGAPADVASTVAMAPGSTYKPILVAAALDAHAITADQTFACGPAPRAYGAKTIQDSAPSSALDLGHLLAVSSNIGASHIFDALGGEHLAQWSARFHLAHVPAHLASGSYEGAAVAMGGGGLTATPLAMAAAYGALASDGLYRAPARDRGTAPAERAVTPETARAVMRLLETAVTDDSATGKAARVDGIRVAGKTGTAEWTTADGKPRTYASFIGVADLPGRRIVALVGVVTARADSSGGKAAAPVFARLVQRIAGR